MLIFHNFGARATFHRRVYLGERVHPVDDGNHAPAKVLSRGVSEFPKSLPDIPFKSLPSHNLETMLFQ